MNKVDQLISSIEDRVNKLIDRSERLGIEKEGLIAKNKELSQIIKEQQQRIKDLESNNNLLTYSESLKNIKGTTEARKQINELVREIDRCISVLKQAQ